MNQELKVKEKALSIERTRRDIFLLVTADQILEELADESIIDLRSHWPLLPLLQIGLYNIPPQPKKVQDWTIMQRKCSIWMFVHFFFFFAFSLSR